METKPLDCSRIPMAEALRVMMSSKPSGTHIKLNMLDAMLAADMYGVVEARNTTQETILAQFQDKLTKEGNPLADIIQGAQNA